MTTCSEGSPGAPGNTGLPLQELRILDLTQNLAGRCGAMLMGDLGAQVIKVEPPEGDFIRQLPPFFSGGESAYFASINRNKESLVVDLKSPEGLNVFYELY